MGWKFNPFTGALDQTGSTPSSYIDGEVATYNDLPLSSTTAPLNTAWLVRGSSGVWPFTKPGGVYIRTATGGSSRDADYTYAGVFPDVFSDANFTIYDEADTSKNLKFQLSGISANTTRTITVPNSNVTLPNQGTSTTDKPTFDGIVVGNQVGSLVTSGAHKSQIVASSSSQTPLVLVGGSGTFEFYKDATPSKAISVGFALPGNAAGNDLVFGHYDGGSWGSLMEVPRNGALDVKTGPIQFADSGDTSKKVLLSAALVDDNSTVTLSAPSTSGTIALTSDIPAAFNPAAPGAIGGTTPSTGAFTSLSASNKLSLPSSAAASPAAGDVYRVSNTLRYRDSTNTERLLLNATDNLANLANTATALSNLGLLGAIRDMKIVSPSSDVTATSSTTLSNVTGMSFSVAANTTYLILTNLQMSVGAGGYNCEISFPSILNNGTTASGFGVQLPGSNTVAGLSTTTATTVKVSNRGAAQTTPSFSILLVRTDSTGGTANFQWAQNASNAAASTISATSRALIVPLTT